MTGRVQSLRSSVAGNRPTGRSPGELYVNFPDMQLGLINASSTAQDLLAVRMFSTTTTYAIGDHVLNGGVIYRAIAASAAGAFVPANWSRMMLLSDLSGYLPLTGGTLTGSVLMTTANPTLTLNKAASGQASYIVGETTGSNRWNVTLGDTTAESGSNAGSDFDITAYNDAGSYLSTPFKITRADGSAFFTGQVYLSHVNPTLTLNKAASGQGSFVLGNMNGAQRWSLSLGDGAAEGGSNAGSNFGVYRYADSGTYIDEPFSITRANGNAAFANNVSITGTLTAPNAAIGAAASGGGTQSLIASNGAVAPTAGKIGELVSSGWSGTVTVSGSNKNVTSIPLTAGVWDVWGTIGLFTGSGGSVTGLFAWLSTTSAGATPIGQDVNLGLTVNLTGSEGYQGPIGRTTITVTAGVTVYLVAYTIGSTGSNTYQGIVSARRVA